MRAIIGRETPVRVAIEDSGGILTDADSTPTVAVTDWNGDAVAGVGTVSQIDTGIYEATLPVFTSEDRLDVVFSATVGTIARTYSGVVPVVQGLVAELGTLRRDAELAELSALNLQDISDIVEDTLEDVLHFPPTPMLEQEIWRFRGGRRMSSPRMRFIDSVVSLDIDGVAYTPADLEVTDGSVYIADGTSFPSGRVTLWATHGPPDSWQRGVPGDMRRAAVILARYTARTNNYPERARMIQTDGAMLTFSMASYDRPTGLPEVDGILFRYRVLEAIA